MNPVKYIRDHTERSVAVVTQAIDVLDGEIARAAQLMIACLRGDGRILCCGNGGSASDALHFSAELLNRYRDDRRPLGRHGGTKPPDQEGIGLPLQLGHFFVP